MSINFSDEEIKKSKELYDSQKDKGVRTEGDYKDGLKNGIWTEWYECYFRDRLDDYKFWGWRTYLNITPKDISDIEVRKVQNQRLRLLEEKLTDEEKDSLKKFRNDDLEVLRNSPTPTLKENIDYEAIGERQWKFRRCTKLVTNYNSGSKEGERTGYSDEEKLILKCNYKNDILDGPFTEWWESGGLMLECNHKNGKLDGLFTEWWENGGLMLECNYKNGKLDGLYTEWGYGGKVELKYNYKNGVKDGEFIVYNPIIVYRI